MQAHILLVGHDRELLEATAWYLGADGWRVTVAGGDAEAVAAGNDERPQAVVADLAGGAELEAAAREAWHAPVLDLRDGASPAAGPMELAGRVRTWLAVTKLGDPAPATVPGLCLLPDSQEAEVHGNAAGLTRLEYLLLEALMARPDTVLSRSHLADALWGDAYYGDLRLVDYHISHLRRKLRRAGLRRALIVTARGEGYLLKP